MKTGLAKTLDKLLEVPHNNDEVSRIFKMKQIMRSRINRRENSGFFKMIKIIMKSMAQSNCSSLTVQLMACCNCCILI
jgi:hypothetical protein